MVKLEVTVVAVELRCQRRERLKPVQGDGRIDGARAHGWRWFASQFGIAQITVDVEGKQTIEVEVVVVDVREDTDLIGGHDGVLGVEQDGVAGFQMRAGHTHAPFNFGCRRGS